MKRIQAVSVKQSITEVTLEKFDLLCQGMHRSRAILKILNHFVEYDQNYIRELLSLTRLSDSEIEQIKSLTLDSLEKPVENTSLVPVETQ